MLPRLAKISALVLSLFIIIPTQAASAGSTYVYTKDVDVGDRFTWTVEQHDLPAEATWANRSLQGVRKIELEVLELPPLRASSLEHDWFAVYLDGVETKFIDAIATQDFGLFELSLFYPMYVSVDNKERYDFFVHVLGATRRADFADWNNNRTDPYVDLVWNAKTGLLETALVQYYDSQGVVTGEFSLKYNRDIRISGAQIAMLMLFLAALAVAIYWKKPQE